MFLSVGLYTHMYIIRKKRRKLKRCRRRTSFRNSKSINSFQVNCLPTCLPACLYVCMYVCMYVYVCMYIYVCVCVCVCNSNTVLWLSSQFRFTLSRFPNLKFRPANFIFLDFSLINLAHQNILVLVPLNRPQA
jgi:hypothetical protein